MPYAKIICEYPYKMAISPQTFLFFALISPERILVNGLRMYVVAVGKVPNSIYRKLESMPRT
jgi:hypothetical protein